MKIRGTYLFTYLLTYLLTTSPLGGGLLSGGPFFREDYSPGDLLSGANALPSYTPRWYARPKTVTHPSSKRLIVRRPGSELTTIEPQVRCPNT